MTNTEVKSRIIKSEKFQWQKAKWLQNENLKECDDASFQKLANSIKKYSFIQPFNVWEDTENGIIWILDGHHRQKTLQNLLNEGTQIPELLDGNFLDCENKKEAAELVLVYSSQYATMTQIGLTDFLEQNGITYAEMNAQVDFSDFSHAKYEQKNDVYDTANADEQEETETAPHLEEKNVIVKSGDFFQLGNHKFLVGSCLEEENFNLLMQGEKAQIIITDPPYNLPASIISGNGKVKHTDFAMGKGEMSHIEFVEFLARYMKNLVKHSKDGSIHYHFMDFRHVWHVCQAASQEDTYKTVEAKQIAVWSKSVAGNGSFYRSQHEMCLIFKSGEAKHKSHLKLEDKYRTNIWVYHSANDYANPDRVQAGGIGELANHPTPKPVQMIADAILDTTDAGDIVIDCFLGSGTALIACQQTDRICRGIELEPMYAQSIIIRYIKYCEKKGINCEFKHLNGNLNLNDFSEWTTPKTLK